MNQSWTEEEVSFLISNYNNMKVKDLALHINKSPKAIKRKIERLNLGFNKHNEWTAEELTYLSQNFYRPSEDLALALPRHTRSSIIKKGYQLGVFKHSIPNIPNVRTRPVKNELTNSKTYKGIASRKLGRKLTSGETVHHINCDSTDNKPENLHVFKNASEHARAHGSLNTLVKQLMERNIIRFDERSGIYFLVE
jgi:hypothetical protein